MRIRKKSMATTLAIATVLTVPATVTAAPQQNPAPNATAPAGTQVERPTAQDWRALADQARRDGNTQLANYYTEKANGDGVSTRGWASWARKAAVYALRHWGDRIPAKIRPWAGKIADILDQTEVWEKVAIITALTRAGVPVDVAAYTADWLVLFLG